MVAVVTELMVGGERSTEDDSIKDPLGFLVSKLLAPSVALSNGQDSFALEKIFALIDEYICADLSSCPNFSLAVLRRTIRYRQIIQPPANPLRALSTTRGESAHTPTSQSRPTCRPRNSVVPSLHVTQRSKACPLSRLQT